MTTTAYAIGDIGPTPRYMIGDWQAPRPPDAAPLPVPPNNPLTLLDRLRQQLAQVREEIAKIEEYLLQLRRVESALADAVERRTVGEEVERSL